MKRCILFFLMLVALLAKLQPSQAQCSICSRTAQQLGERPAKALNKGIIYLALTPLAIGGFIGYRWWRSEKGHE